MSIMGEIREAVKIGAHLLRGHRLCHGCGVWVGRDAHTFQYRAFCGRLCAIRWIRERNLGSGRSAAR